MIVKLNSFISLTKSEIKQIDTESIEIVYKRGAIIEDSNISKLMFIAKGMGRHEIIKENGESFTADFFFENEFIRSIPNFNNNKIITKRIEVLEKVKSVEINIETLKTILESNPEVAICFKNIAEIELLKIQKSIVVRGYSSKSLVFQNLLKLYPNIEQRVSQKIIASFLDISPVHLSRLKSKLS